MDAITKQTAVADSPGNEVGDAVRWQNADKADGPMGPVAGETDLTPLGNLSLPAATKRGAPDGVELTALELHDRISVAHVNDECERTRWASVTVHVHCDSR